MADTTERHIALREAHQISASDSFFAARKELRDTEHERYIFDAGFRRGFDCHESLQRKAEATTPADAALADDDIPPHYTNSEAAAFECGYQKSLRARQEVAVPEAFTVVGWFTPPCSVEWVPGALSNRPAYKQEIYVRAARRQESE